MTGAYLRVCRDGKFHNIEVEHLTDDERESVLTGADRDRLMQWINLLCHQVTANEQLLNQLVKDGVLDMGES